MAFKTPIYASVTMSTTASAELLIAELTKLRIRRQKELRNVFALKCVGQRLRCALIQELSAQVNDLEDTINSIKITLELFVTDKPVGKGIEVITLTGHTDD